MSLQHLHALSHQRLHAACGCAAPSRFSLGSTARKYERNREYIVTHLALDLDVDFKSKSILGNARLDFSRRAPSAKELRLDAHGFSISKVELSFGKKTKELATDDYSYDGEEIVVPLTSEVNQGSLTIHYRATPRLGLYFLEADKQVPDRPQQVWSQCQDEDGKFWFPCQDKPHVKMTYELKARVPQKMSVLSGGRLIEKKTPKKGAWEYHYRLDEKTPAYLITLVVGEFEQWSESVTLPSGREVQLNYWVPQGRKADGKRAFSSTPAAVELFSKTTGVEYPFESYTQVVVSDFIFGGMENTTATTMYEHILFDQRAALDIDSNDLVAHELAHHWFGDLVTCRDWSHAWLNEGFATYFEHIEREARLGRDEYEHHVTVDLNIYLGEAGGNYQRAIVCRDYDEPIDLFDRHLYQKGGLVLHMLRQRLGDDCFFQGIKNYLSAHRGGIVETNDLMRALEESSGLSLERFFDEWVYRPGHPSLKVNVSYGDGALTVDVEQTQKGAQTATFELPFEIELSDGKSTQIHSRLISEKTSSLVVPLSKRPSWVSIDPRFLITAPITLSAPADLLRNLLKQGEQARARRMAARALCKRQDPDTIEALASSLQDNKEAWMVRAKAAESLGRIGGADARSELLAAQQVEHPKVRRAVAEALGQVRGEGVFEALNKLSNDKSYLVCAAAARSLGSIHDERSGKVLRSLLKKDSWSEVIRAASLSALSHEHSDEAIGILLEWTAYGKPLRARRAALAALSSVGEGLKVRLHLQEMLNDHDPHIRSAVLSALSGLGDSKAKAAISALLERELDGGVRSKARSVLSKLGKDGSPGIVELREENQKLRQELNSLATRLSKLEQLGGAKSANKSGSSSSKKSFTTKKTVGKTRGSSTSSAAKSDTAAKKKSKAPTKKSSSKASSKTNLSRAKRAPVENKRGTKK